MAGRAESRDRLPGDQMSWIAGKYGGREEEGPGWWMSFRVVSHARGGAEKIE